MGNFQKNSKIYAGANSVKMFENVVGGFLTKPKPDFENICLKAYRRYLGDAEIASSTYKRLNFLPYINIPITDREWLPESYIGTFTGKTYDTGSETFIQVEYMANKRTFKPSGVRDVVCAYSDIQRLAWVNENEVSETGY